MTKHTKEPWIVRRHVDGTVDTTILDANGKEVVATHYLRSGHYAPYQGAKKGEANAERIVACVNACAGVSTEELVAFGADVARTGSGKLVEYVAALKATLPLLHASYLDHDGTDNGEAILRVLEQVREVLGE